MLYVSILVDDLGQILGGGGSSHGIPSFLTAMAKRVGGAIDSGKGGKARLHVQGGGGLVVATRLQLRSNFCQTQHFPGIARPAVFANQRRIRGRASAKDGRATAAAAQRLDVGKTGWHIGVPMNIVRQPPGRVSFQR